ncbi:MAG TPA: HEPN domain-containing protein [Nitrospiraceae bacterium]|nr:HEPN domain-containing protein [Nitrospiraceae bacterium]
MSQAEIKELLDKAQRSLRAAERLMADGDHDFAVSRAYYAMFYAAQALLLTKDIRRSKHSAVLSAFNESFVKTGAVAAEHFHRLRDGFEDRAESDYGLAAISQEQACRKPCMQPVYSLRKSTGTSPIPSENRDAPAPNFGQDTQVGEDAAGPCAVQDRRGSKCDLGCHTGVVHRMPVPCDLPSPLAGEGEGRR